MKYFIILSALLAVSCSTPEGREFRKKRTETRRTERILERNLGSIFYDVDIINDTLIMIIPSHNSVAMIKPYVINIRDLGGSIIDNQKVVFPNKKKNHIEYHENR